LSGQSVDLVLVPI